MTLGPYQYIILFIEREYNSIYFQETENNTYLDNICASLYQLYPNETMGRRKITCIPKTICRGAFPSSPYIQSHITNNQAKKNNILPELLDQQNVRCDSKEHLPVSYR